MSSDAPQLLITNPAGEQTICLLDEAITWKIGRGKSSNIVLEDDAASRRHAIIQRTEMGEYYLMDVGSRNGTFILGKRVSTPVVLNDGDVIAIGGHKLVFHSPIAQFAPRDRSARPDEESGMATRVMFAERMVTVLVVDVRGFTPLTQQIDQDVLCKFISRWFSDASGIFRARGSWALKYIGDAVMGAWLHEHGKEEAQAIAALTAVSEFAALSSASRYSLPCPLSFGAGLNTGIASVGNAGSGEQTEYTAFGDAVNAAFRIEHGTRDMQCDIALGHGTVGCLGGPGAMKGFFRDEVINMKGYDEPTTVWAGSYDDLRRFLASRKT